MSGAKRKIMRYGKRGVTVKRDNVLFRGTHACNRAAIKKLQLAAQFDTDKLKTFADGQFVSGITFRSRMEANWAMWLDYRVRVLKDLAWWTYEGVTFHFPTQRVKDYRPDIMLVYDKPTPPFYGIVFVEIKGCMNSRTLTQLSRMRKYHPSVDVALVDYNRYKTVAQKVSHIVPGWL